MELFRRIFLLIWGCCLLSIAIVLTVHAGLGTSPWDVFHLGLTNVTSLTFGQAGQLTGFIILLIAALLGEYPGWGTIYNTFVIGFLIDIIRQYEIIPYAVSPWQSWVMLFAGILLMGWGTYFYLQAELGSGPRDSLMMALIKRYKQPVWKIRMIIETIALIMGYFLGGLVGIGTVASAIMVGIALQMAFKFNKRKASDIKHRVIWEDYLAIKGLLSVKKTSKEKG